MIRKRWSALPLLFGTVTFLAAGILYAQLRSGSYESHNAAHLPQPSLPELAPDGKYDAGSYLSSIPELAPGEGKAEVQSFCAICHSTRYIVMQPPLPAASWDAEVSKMIKVYGAPIPEATAKKITVYLQEHYAPENRKE